MDWYTKRYPSNYEKKEGDHRTPYERDCCRVIHSYPFRRLQGKLQIVNGNESDFHRNRLTHSIEVASIAQNIFRNLKQRIDKKSVKHAKKFINDQSNDTDTLIFTIGLLHDIGHPPFGHAGEVALNYKMNRYTDGNSGFEGNAQTLRLITELNPLNLTYRTLLGVLKYPVKYSKFDRKHNFAELSPDNNLISYKDWLPPKCYYDEESNIVNLLISNFENDKDDFTKLNKDNKAEYKTFDCSIMDIADDISYSIHDLEDALFFKLINKQDLMENKIISKFLETRKISINLFFGSNNQEVKIGISSLIHEVINDIRIKINPEFHEPLLKYYVGFKHDSTKKFIKELKRLVNDKMIDTHHVKSVRQGGMRAIMQIFDAFAVRPELMPKEENAKYNEADTQEKQMRVIADYISGMTDQYLFKMHRRLFGVNEQNTFDVLG